MTRIALQQPYIFPYRGFFDLIKAVDIFVIYDDVQWMKRSWINRNYFPDRYTFPVEHQSIHKNINQHYYKGFKTACKKFPIQTELTKKIFKLMNPEYNVAINNAISIVEICRELNIDTKFVLASDIRHGKGVQVIRDIVHALGGDTYVNLPGGKELYNQDMFDPPSGEAGFKLEFIETKPGKSILLEL